MIGSHVKPVQYSQPTPTSLGHVCMHVWVLSCHLHFWQNDRGGLLLTTVVTRGWNGHRIKVKTESYLWRRNILPPLPCSGELRTQKLKSHLMRTQSLKVLPLNPGVDQSIAMHATLLLGISSLLISTLPLHSFAFFQNLSQVFFCVSCG